MNSISNQLADTIIKPSELGVGVCVRLLSYGEYTLTVLIST